jgi:hypothetical protein
VIWPFTRRKSAKLKALHESQDAAYWRGHDAAHWWGEYERALIKLKNQRAALKGIRNQGIKSASGTARAMARKAGEALT